MPEASWIRGSGSPGVVVGEEWRGCSGRLFWNLPAGGASGSFTSADKIPTQSLAPSPGLVCWDLALVAPGAPRAGYLPETKPKHLNPRTAVSRSSGLNRGANSKWISSWRAGYRLQHRRGAPQGRAADLGDLGSGVGPPRPGGKK